MKNLFNLKELILDGNKIFFLEKKVFEVIVEKYGDAVSWQSAKCSTLFKQP